MIQRIDDCIHLAELDDAGTLRGSCILNPWIEGIPSGDLYLFGLNTKPEHRRQGVATELIKAAQRVAKLRGNKAIYLEPLAYADRPVTTERLIDWYERNGFKLTTDEQTDRTVMVWNPSD